MLTVCSFMITYNDVYCMVLVTPFDKLFTPQAALGTLRIRTACSTAPTFVSNLPNCARHGILLFISMLIAHSSPFQGTSKASSDYSNEQNLG